MKKFRVHFAYLSPDELFEIDGAKALPVVIYRATLEEVRAALAGINACARVMDNGGECIWRAAWSGGQKRAPTYAQAFGDWYDDDGGQDD